MYKQETMSTLPLIAITQVDVLDSYKFRLHFNDGTIKLFDMVAHRERYQGPIFRPLWNDPGAFARVRVEGDSIVWDCGADIAPERLYQLAEEVDVQTVQQSR